MAEGEAVCPQNLVIQKDWWPETEHGGTYQLIGAGGESDPSLFTYSGPIDPAYAVGGIETVEIRSGGDAIEFQPVSAVMKTDQDITLGYVNTDDAIQSSPTVEVTAVATTLEINPQMIMWDPEQLDADPADPATIGETGARVLHFGDATYIDWMIANGYLDESQSDPNYGGCPRPVDHRRRQLHPAGLRHQRDLQVRERDRMEGRCSGTGRLRDHPRARLAALPGGLLGAHRSSRRTVAVSRAAGADAPAGVGRLPRQPRADR